LSLCAQSMVVILTLMGYVVVSMPGSHVALQQNIIWHEKGTFQKGPIFISKGGVSETSGFLYQKGTVPRSCLPFVRRDTSQADSQQN
jgi:hypothetical protein